MGVRISLYALALGNSRADWYNDQTAPSEPVGPLMAMGLVGYQLMPAKHFKASSILVLASRVR